MPRPNIDFGAEWRGSLRAKIEPQLAEALKQKPLTESEMFGAAVAALGGKGSYRKLATDLRKMYGLQFKRKISERTASLSVIRSLKQAVNETKEALLDKEHGAKYGTTFYCVDKPIQFGQDYYGRIFYSKDSEEMLVLKATSIILKHGRLAGKLLRKIETEDYVVLKKIPYQKRLIDLAVGLLSAYGLAEACTVGGEQLLAKPGFDPQTIKLESASSEATMEEAGVFKAKGFAVRENFYAGRWVLSADGPCVAKFKFSIVAFDRENKHLHVADVLRKRADVSGLKELRDKAHGWGLPSGLHFFAPSFTESAEKYAARWGITLHKGKDI